MNRKILHVDIDAFFASVEQLDHPELKGKPVMVGGTSERGVVAAASYEARRFGVHSAMSTKMARSLCPLGIFVNGRHDRYREISREVFKIMRSITDQLEKVSIDEAFLDITDLPKPALEIANEIKRMVKDQIGLTISVGISYNKFLAKLASEWNKPNGVFEIRESDIPDILKPFPIIKVHGLGKKTAAKLNRIGIFKVDDLLKYPLESLIPIMGELWAIEIYNRIRGIDDRPVVTSSERKSYGKETTFFKDTNDKQYLIEVLREYARELLGDLKRINKGIRTTTLKVKYEDFEQITRSHSVEYLTNDLELIRESIELIMNNIELHKKVRLIGISFSNISDYKNIQLSFFDRI
ncbi:DNA polymerase IV [Alkaliphilus hydrothermalis]|uniref:DNA polymerase IV n=1 Tax=Alkaliphilus hydrothermalis TaxID=1482730 RepID=A0ABS2NML0_9FIRM|nr:DNA polymerase IV [Alkaliphilus hydrothermalis]MBM7613809.1 DNA polymerase-4 [Alkaliphilus hydrothermalis]